MTIVLDPAERMRKQAYRILQEILDKLELKGKTGDTEVTMLDLQLLRTAQQILTDLRKDEREDAAKLDLAALTISDIERQLSSANARALTSPMEKSAQDVEIPNKRSTRGRPRLRSK